MSAYLDYLQRRSKLALLYRRGWLYPRLCRHLRGRVLDVGFGIGDMLRFRPNTVGVDIDPDAVAWASGQGLDVRLMQPGHLPFDDAYFDGAVLDNVLEHIDEPAPLLAEIRRVLTVGSVLVVGVPGKRGYASDPDHKVFYDADALTCTLSAACFEREAMLELPLPAWTGASRLSQYCLYGVFVRA
jgi:SAM-dependent methyltransferase